VLKNTDWCGYTTQACIAQDRNSRSALESAEAYAQQNCFFMFKMKLDLSDYLLAKKNSAWLFAGGTIKAPP
jgi:hypothetical protein